MSADDFPFGVDFFAAAVFFVEVEVEVEAAMEGETVAAETVRLGGRLPARRTWCRGCTEAKAPAGRASRARPSYTESGETRQADPRQGSM